MAQITLSAMIGGFRFVDLSTGCKAVHSPKDRKGCRVSAAEALDEHGSLRRKYEAIIAPDGKATGEYALRADAPVYAEADERLKAALRKVNSLLDTVCYSVGGGSRVLTEANYPAWQTTLEAIAAEVQTATEEIDAMRIDADDPNSPTVNDFLRARGRKPISLAFKPLLHPEVRIADPDAQEQARAFVRATQEQVKEIIAAVQSADPDRISLVLSEAKNIENAIADESTRVSIRRLLEVAEKAKVAAQTEREKERAALKAQERINGRTGTDAKTVTALNRDAAAILRFQTESVQAAAIKQAAIAEIAGPAADLSARFAGLDLGDESDLPLSDEEIAQPVTGRAIVVDMRDEIAYTDAERIAAAARQVQAQDSKPARMIDAA